MVRCCLQGPLRSSSYYPAYGMANALLGLKAAWDKAGPTAEPTEVGSALAGSTFQGIAAPIAMARANGRQAIAEAASERCSGILKARLSLLTCAASRQIASIPQTELLDSSGSRADSPVEAADRLVR